MKLLTELQKLLCNRNKSGKIDVEVPDLDLHIRKIIFIKLLYLQRLSF